MSLVKKGIVLGAFALGGLVGGGTMKLKADQKADEQATLLQACQKTQDTFSSLAVKQEERSVLQKDMISMQRQQIRVQDSTIRALNELHDMQKKKSPSF
jgi:type IV secretory pathway VirJ component